MNALVAEVVAVLGSIVALVTMIWRRRAACEDGRQSKKEIRDAAISAEREIRKMALFDALRRRDRSAMHRALVEQLRIAREGDATAGGSERTEGE